MTTIRVRIGKKVYKLLAFVIGAPIELRLQQPRDTHGRFAKK